jgi:dipeptidyl aminopeptidase/acylaminoacyl peptidase
MKNALLSITLILTLLVFNQSFAQGTLADYLRAESADTLFNNKIYHSPEKFQWLNSGDKFWYLNKGKNEKNFILVDVKNKLKQPAFDHEKIAELFQKQLKKDVSAKSLPFESIEFSKDEKAINIQIEDKLYVIDIDSYTLSSLSKSIKNPNQKYWGSKFDELSNGPVVSPDSTKEAFIREYNVYYRDRANGRQVQLSFDGSEGEFYSSYIQWAPDSKKLVSYKVRPAADKKIYFIESSPKDQVQPKLHERNYPKPGDALPQKFPQLFLIDPASHVQITGSFINNQFSLGNIKWREDGRAFTFEFNQRGHQNYKIIEVKVPSGEVAVVLDEHSKTFIDYSGKKYRYDVNDGKEIIWASERDGWNHLYLYDGINRKVKNQITKGNWVVRGVDYVNEKDRLIFFRASGREIGEDPYHIHYYRINFDGTGLTKLTDGNGNHKATFSPDFKYFVDYYSRVDLPPVSVLRSTTDGSRIMEIEKADVRDLLKTGWHIPEIFTAKGRDNTTDIWGIIIRPSNFDPGKSYPIIEYIYAGPHSSHVPKDFHPNVRQLHSLAELGFIIVQIDGMGTSNRSKAFHDVCWQNLKDAGFPDRIPWIKAAAKKYPYIDINKVGIFGGSAGGQNSTGALLFHSDFYKVAVSSCGCHDNRMDKIWWNEQWMGYPIGPHYEACSNVVNASKLQGKLMLILGELDDNVDPASTLQLVDALIKEDKEFEFIMVPGMGHSSGGKYGERKRRDFFVKNLLGIEPPDWNQLQKKDAKVLSNLK